MSNKLNRFSNKGLRKINNEERMLFDWVKQTLKNVIPKKYLTSQLCNFNFNSFPPKIIKFSKDENRFDYDSKLKKKDGYSGIYRESVINGKNEPIIEYQEGDDWDNILIHEFTHYLNYRSKSRRNIPWEGLNETIAFLIERVYCLEKKVLRLKRKIRKLEEKNVKK